jgi:hypothetical protein
MTIVGVIFRDTSGKQFHAPCTESELRQYLATGYTAAIQSKAATRAIGKTVEASERARLPRKALPSVKEIEKLREAFSREQGRAHGWKAEACRHFRIDRKTLNALIEE